MKIFTGERRYYHPGDDGKYAGFESPEKLAEAYKTLKKDHDTGKSERERLGAENELLMKQNSDLIESARKTKPDDKPDFKSGEARKAADDYWSKLDEDQKAEDFDKTSLAKRIRKGMRLEQAASDAEMRESQAKTKAEKDDAKRLIAEETLRRELVVMKRSFGFKGTAADIKKLQAYQSDHPDLSALEAWTRMQKDEADAAQKAEEEKKRLEAEEKKKQERVHDEPKLGDEEKSGDVKLTPEEHHKRLRNNSKVKEAAKKLFTGAE